MSKTKTVDGQDYRWDYQKQKWVRSYGGSGGEALTSAAKGLARGASHQVSELAKGNFPGRNLLKAIRNTGKTMETLDKKRSQSENIKNYNFGGKKSLNVSEEVKPTRKGKLEDYNLKAKEASKGDPKGPFGGKNPFIKKERTFGDDLKAATSKSSSKSSSGSKSKTNTFTRHYKTGKELGVMSRNARKRYEKEAAGRTFEGEVAKHAKASGHGQSHRRETLYISSARKGGKAKDRKRKSSGYQFQSNILKHYNK
tara:strand:+ start:91 stop:852 length:762 start_codon:yes stop_codon:yes gene_type:complete